MHRIQEELMVLVDVRINELEERAQIMVDDFWSFRLGESKKRTDFHSKSRIFPRIKKTSSAFSIEWYHILEWYRNLNGDWKKKTRYVAQGKGDRMKGVVSFAQEWEMEKLELFEDEAELIRKEIRYLMSVKRSYKSLKRRENQINAKYSYCDG